MEPLVINNKIKLDADRLVRIGDLSYFEGPLLSLFEELNSGHFYLFDWVDRDMKSNRWLIYRVHPKYLLRYLSGAISHLEVFNHKPEGNVFFIDIDAKNNPFYNYDALALKDIPEMYYPNDENFFDKAACNSFEKIRSVIIDSLSRQKSENEYFHPRNVDILKPDFGTKFYFNRFPTNQLTDRHTQKKRGTVAKSPGNLSPFNNIGYPDTKISSSEIPAIKKRKAYANHYD